MNEFTKEDLELIAECVEADFYHTNWSKSVYEPLINKIQSMIDNFERDQTVKKNLNYIVEKAREWRMEL